MRMSYELLSIVLSRPKGMDNVKAVNRSHYQVLAQACTLLVGGSRIVPLIQASVENQLPLFTQQPYS